MSDGGISDERLESMLGEALRWQDQQDRLARQVEVEQFLGGSMTASEGTVDYWSHSGDVHAANEFGFDLRVPEDAEHWVRITGETPVIPPTKGF